MNSQTLPGNSLRPMIRIDLKQFDTEYQRAGRTEQKPVQHSRPVSDVPDGQYHVMVERLELTTAKSSGNPMLKWKLRITAGPFLNRVMYKNRAITQTTIEWVKKEMECCGLDLTPFSSLPTRLEEMTGVNLGVVKVTKNGNDNIYIKRRFSGGPDHELAALADALPF